MKSGMHLRRVVLGRVDRKRDYYGAAQRQEDARKGYF